MSPPTQINTYTDNKSFYHSTNTTSQIAGKTLRAEMPAIREMKDKGEIKIKVYWKSKENG